VPSSVVMRDSRHTISRFGFGGLDFIWILDLGFGISMQPCFPIYSRPRRAEIGFLTDLLFQVPA
jgi:hypothetical protein